MNKTELIKNLRRTIQEQKVNSYWIEQSRGRGYSEKQDNWINVYYIEEWLNHDSKKQQITASEKQKTELLKPYGTFKQSYFSIENVPPEIAEQLYGKWPNLNPKMAFNSSPKMKKLVELAKQFNGTLSGFVIPVESGRDDARIQFDAIYLRCSKEDAKRLRRNLKPNEFDLKKDGTYRFWWD